MTRGSSFCCVKIFMTRGSSQHDEGFVRHIPRELAHPFIRINKLIYRFILKIHFD